MPKLSDLAEIYSGFPVQGSVMHDPAGTALIVRPVDGNERHEIDWRNVARIVIPEQKRHRRLAAGDVLFRSVGTVNPTWLVTEVPDDVPAIAHQHFLQIRLKDPVWDPGFITLLFNSDRIQQYFRGQASGATQAIVRRGVLENFEVPTIDLADQKQLVAEWHQHCDEVERLEKRLIELRASFSSAFDAKLHC
ncbi:MAG: hypothetical protein ACJAVI_005532 [Candidatus Azotimanducaceae bacterium]|jgi:hypothetical protein